MFVRKQRGNKSTYVKKGLVAAFFVWRDMFAEFWWLWFLLKKFDGQKICLEFLKGPTISTLFQISNRTRRVAKQNVEKRCRHPTQVPAQSPLRRGRNSLLQSTKLSTISHCKRSTNMVASQNYIHLLKYSKELVASFAALVFGQGHARECRFP